MLRVIINVKLRYFTETLREKVLYFAQDQIFYLVLYELLHNFIFKLVCP